METNQRHAGSANRKPVEVRSAIWQLRSSTLRFPPAPLLMGIVNVTPDSFSDGGQYLDHQAAIEHGLQLARDGADILDIGGESTRPYASPVDADEEMLRVIPVVRALVDQSHRPISIDTGKAEVARAAVDVGAEIINDVGGFRCGELVEVARQSGAAVCAMHMQGTPQTMQRDPRYEDVVTDILVYLRGRRDALREAGIPQEKICLDPGIGFGKTHQHNLTLLANCERFHALGCPLLVGHSRKGFIGKILEDQDADRTFGSIGVALSLARQAVHVIRVHDVNAVRQALLLFEATGGVDGRPRQLD